MIRLDSSAVSCPLGAKRFVMRFSRFLLIVLVATAGPAALYVALSPVVVLSPQTALLPLGFALFGAACLLMTHKRTPSLFLTGLAMVAYGRFVAFPVLATLSGGYVGRSWQPPAASSADLAVGLMLYELVAIALVVALLEPRSPALVDLVAPKPARQRAVPGWYVVCLLAASVVLVVATPGSLERVNFGSPTVAGEPDENRSVAGLAGIVFTSSLAFAALGLIHRVAASRRYALLAPVISTLLVGVNVSVFFGTNRLAVVLTAIGSMVVMAKYFSTRVLVGPLAITVVVVTVLFAAITDVRQYAPVASGGVERAADLLQVYTGGIYNVAIGVETVSMFPEVRSWRSLVHDFLRPTVGFNVLVRDSGTRYSNEYFNLRMWTHVERRSQILPMVAQGYLYFGASLAPLLSVLFVVLGYALQHMLSAARYVELQFALTVSTLRLALLLGQNSMNLMNYLSLYLLIPTLLLVPYFLLLRIIPRTARSGQRTRRTRRAEDWHVA